MKKTGILLIITVLFGTACTDYLKEDNRSTITTDEYYATATGFETLVNACYSTLRELYTDMNVDNDNQKSYNSFHGAMLLGTDLYCTGKLADQNDILDGYFLITPDHWAFTQIFSTCYKSIQLHNVALSWVNKTVQTDVLPLRAAEVRFIRAYMYYILLENFGGVSIIEEAFDKPVASFPRDSEEDVYAFIIKELNDILQILPEQPEAEGRITLGAAEHLLSLVHLSRGYNAYAAADDFAKAEEYATNIIESGNYSMLGEFSEVFKIGNEQNEEIIFAIQFDKSSFINGIAGHRAHAWGGTYASSTPGWPYRPGQIRPTDQCYLQYNISDARYEATFMVNKYDPYYDFYDDAKPEEDKIITTFYPHASLEPDPDDPPPTHWVYLDEYTVFDSTRVEWEDKNYPWVRKFDDPTAIVQYDNSRDFFLFRLAETYLIRAEAKIKQGESGDEDIYAVRKRSWDVMPVNADIDTLLDERGRELMGECKRWMDLRRTGKLQERASLHNPSVSRYLEQGYDPFNGGAKALRRPIPTDVIIRDVNGYDQNNGY